MAKPIMEHDVHMVGGFFASMLVYSRVIVIKLLLMIILW